MGLQREGPSQQERLSYTNVFGPKVSRSSEIQTLKLKSPAEEDEEAVRLAGTIQTVTGMWELSRPLNIAW